MTAVATELSKPSATTDALKAKVATIRSLYRKVIDVAPASAADISKAMLHAIDDLSTMLDPVGYDVAKAPQARIDAQMAEDQANADVLQPYGVATCGPTFGSPAG